MEVETQIVFQIKQLHIYYSARVVPKKSYVVDVKYSINHFLLSITMILQSLTSVNPKDPFLVYCELRDKHDNVWEDNS